MTDDFDQTYPIVTAVKAYAKPGEEDEVIAAFLRSQEKLQGRFGCGAFKVHQNLLDPTHILVLERWESVEQNLQIFERMTDSLEFHGFRRRLQRDLNISRFAVRTRP